MGEGQVEGAGALLAGAEGDADTGFLEDSEAATADEGVGVRGGDDDAADAGLNERLGAGAGAAMMGAGLEGDKGGGAADIVAARGGLLQRSDFGVVAVGEEVGAFTEDAGFGAGRGEDAADGGVWAAEADGCLGEVERACHEELVRRCGGGGSWHEREHSGFRGGA